MYFLRFIFFVLIFGFSGGECFAFYGYGQSYNQNYSYYPQPYSQADICHSLEMAALFSSPTSRTNAGSSSVSNTASIERSIENSEDKIADQQKIIDEQKDIMRLSFRDSAFATEGEDVVDAIERYFKEDKKFECESDSVQLKFELYRPFILNILKNALLPMAEAGGKRGSGGVTDGGEDFDSGDKKTGCESNSNAKWDDSRGLGNECVFFEDECKEKGSAWKWNDPNCDSLADECAKKAGHTWEPQHNKCVSPATKCTNKPGHTWHPMTNNCVAPVAPAPVPVPAPTTTTGDTCSEWKEHFDKQKFFSWINKKRYFQGSKFCKNYAKKNDKKKCKNAGKQIVAAIKEIREYESKIEKLENRLSKAEAEDFKRMLGTSEETEAGAPCYECLEELRALGRPTTGQTIGNLSTMLMGVGLGYMGQRAGQSAQREVNELRSWQGFEPQNNFGSSLAGIGIAYPFISQGLYGLSQNNSSSCGSTVNVNRGYNW